MLVCRLEFTVRLTHVIDLPDSLATFLSSSIKRVVFLANNPNVASALLNGLALSEEDVLVQYNTPMFFDIFARRLCHKVHMFSQKHWGYCWGFTDTGAPNRDYVGQDFASLTFFMLRRVPELLCPYLQSVSDRATVALISNADVPLYCTLGQCGEHEYNYPTGKTPSAGFSSINVFRFINWLRYLRSVPRAELVAIGFTGVYQSGYPWEGHDFSYEQCAYTGWLDLTVLGC